MKSSLKSFLLVFFIFFLTLFAVTYGLLNGYFQQDEWLSLATTIKSFNLPWWDIFVPGNLHFSPVGHMFWRSMYNTFGLQAQYYFLAQLIVHASTSTLVYILTERLTKKKGVAAITGLLFLLNGRAHQAFTHLAIFHVTTTAMMFMVLFFVYLSGIKEHVIRAGKGFVLFLIFLAAVSTREEGFMLIPLFAAYLWCFDRKKINWQNAQFYSLFILGVAAFTAFRLFAQTLYTTPIPIQYQVTGAGAEYNVVTLPLKFIVQNLIYSERIGLFMLANTQKLYPAIESFFTSHAPMYDAGFFYVFSLMAGVASLWLWLVRPKGLEPLTLFFAVWIMTNAVVLAFVGRHISVLEPRYLYYSAFPVLCMTGIFIHSLFTYKGKMRIVELGTKAFSVALLAALLLTSFQEIRDAVSKQYRDGVAKKQIFSSLMKVHPELSDNTIFYLQCSKPCYRNREFGADVRNILPFSSGPGMIFLVHYAVGLEKKWGDFFTPTFLFDAYAEDYKKIGDKSFGYFTTKEKLEQTLKEHHLSKDIVVALEVDEATYTFTDISEAFRKTLSVK